MSRPGPARFSAFRFIDNHCFRTPAFGSLRETIPASLGKISQLLLLAIISLSVPLFGQGPQPGDPSFSPIESHGYYSIGLQDLHINVDVPIRSKTGFGNYHVAGSNYTYISHPNTNFYWAITTP